MNETNGLQKNSSFRDPSGFVFEKEGNVYRYISLSYFNVYNNLKKQKFYNRLFDKGWLIPHKVIEESSDKVVLQVEKIPFISYPYEWSFLQLKSAALLTLKIQYESLKHDVILKDASAYNIQFIGNKPIFIDTTSFEFYNEGQVWSAYKQFCEHFVSPLVLMKYRDTSCLQLLLSNLDGIPLSFASSLLPFSSNFNSLCALHIHAHARKVRKCEQKFFQQKPSVFLHKKKLLQIVEHLYYNIEKLELDKKSSWIDYYKTCLYNEDTLQEKLNFVRSNFSTYFDGFVLDIGCNEGLFSKALVNDSNYIIAIDNDELVINNFFDNTECNEKILPLVVDITNPSPSIGWENNERLSFLNRIGTNNFILALALVHHLRIFYNIPLAHIAKLFAKLSQQLIIEFVPKTDVQVQKLLFNKNDIYDDYSESNFVSCFSKYFKINEMKSINGRILYKMTRK